MNLYFASLFGILGLGMVIGGIQYIRRSSDPLSIFNGAICIVLGMAAAILCYILTPKK